MAPWREAGDRSRGEERGGGGGMGCGLKRRAPGYSNSVLARVFSQWGRQQEVEHRQGVKCN